jgi:hypothetical protein
MSNFFKKPIDEITVDDVKKLKGIPESQVFEIKQSLSAEGDKKTDPWMTNPSNGEHRESPSDKAKEKIFREIVAFANSEGGWLVLGIKETDKAPSRADEICPIPDCCELANRLCQAAYDWIDPPLPSLRFIGIETNGNEGVVVCRVPRSSMAPHRLYKSKYTQEAYKRVGWESKPMRMREIQDLVLEIARGSIRLEHEFKKARQDYDGLIVEKKGDPQVTGCRITLVPEAAPLIIDRPYTYSKDVFFSRDVSLRYSDRGIGSYEIQPLEYRIKSSVTDINPMLRGAYREWHIGESTIKIEIFENGTINIFIKERLNTLYLCHILYELANGLLVMDRMRIVGGNTEAEYALEIELESTELPSARSVPFKLKLIDSTEEFTPEEGIILPYYRVGHKNDFNRIIKRVMDDLLNALGHHHLENLEFEIIDPQED